MRLDHVFICCDVGAPEADALLAVGLVEGARNVHPGQGTANRRFFFAAGFIELLWIAEPAEAQSALTAPTRLWPRWLDRRAGACPFGAVFSASHDADERPPFPTWEYRPRYLPEGRALRFAEATPLGEPELVYMPWPNAPTPGSQPIRHALPFGSLRAAAFGVPTPLDALSGSARAALETGLIRFYPSPAFELTLELTAPRAVQLDLHPSLPLVLAGSPEAAR